MWASQPYATQENEIGIQFHNGVDYFVNEREAVLSAVSGTFKEARVMERQPDGAFQVNLMIVTDGGQGDLQPRAIGGTGRQRKNR